MAMERKSSIDEFVKWEDLDLELLLGDFTDDECEDSDGSSRKPAVKKSATEYRCPCCSRTYRSVAGFRAHAAQKHGKPNLRASDYVERSTTDPESSPTPMPVVSLPWEFGELLSETNQRIMVDPENTNPKSFCGHAMVEIATLTKPYLDQGSFPWMKKPFYDLTSNFTRTNMKSADREKLFVDFHKFRMNTEIRQSFSIFLRSTVAVPHPLIQVNRFISLFMEELLDVFLKRQTEEAKTTRVAAGSTAELTLSPNDQEIIFYISGYVLNKCVRRSDIASEDKVLLSSFLQESDTKENEAQDKWTKKVDRGGLKYPTKQACSLFLAAEQTIRESVDVKNLGPHSLQGTIDAVMDSPRVKKAWGILVPGFCQKMDLCKKLLKVLVTVRGFATVKHIKRNFPKKIKSNGTGKQSIRKTLIPRV